MKYLIFVLLFSPIILNSQSYLLYHGDTVNKINSNGPRYGRQIFFSGGMHMTNYEGNAKIIINKNIDWENEKLSQDNETMFRVVDKNGNYIRCFSKFQDSLSVFDGYWLEYGVSDFEALMIYYYSNGIEKNSKKVKNNKIEIEEIKKEKGNNSYTHEYFDGDTSIAKIRYWSGKNKNKVVCFPNRALDINRCEMGLYALYSKPAIDTIILTSRTNESILIKEITCSNIDVQVTNTKGEKINNLTISKKKDTLLVIYSPKTTTNDGNDLIKKYNYYAEVKLVTPKYNYVLKAQLVSVHIDFDNWNIKELQIKKEKCKPTFLEIYLGDYRCYLLSSTADLTNLKDLINKNYNSFLGISYTARPDIELTNLPIGEYYLIIHKDDGIFQIIKILLTD